MKVGMRTPNIKKRVKANTTAKAKRAVKGAVNPFYGKKGMGMINDPKKAIYNKVYNKTTVSADELLMRSLENTSQPHETAFQPHVSKTHGKAHYIFFMVAGIIIFFISVLLLFVTFSALISGVLSVAVIIYGIDGMRKVQKNEKDGNIRPGVK